VPLLVINVEKVIFVLVVCVDGKDMQIIEFLIWNVGFAVDAWT